MDISEIIINKTLPRKTLVFDLEYVNLSLEVKINVEICNNCHPYFTGKQNLIDTAGRIEKYMEKYNLTEKDLKK